MSTQKPTEAIPVKKTIADATKFSQGLSSVELTEAILTALSAAGYVIVPKAAPDGWAMVNVKMWDDLLRMIAAAEKGE